MYGFGHGLQRHRFYFSANFVWVRRISYSYLFCLLAPPIVWTQENVLYEDCCKWVGSAPYRMFHSDFMTGRYVIIGTRMARSEDQAFVLTVSKEGQLNLIIFSSRFPEKLPELTHHALPLHTSQTSTNLGGLVRLSKAAVRAVCCAHLPASTAPLLEALDLRPLLILLVEKPQLFVYRCIHGKCSQLFREFFHQTGSMDDNRRITRGDNSSLVAVPFIPGPCGRSQIRLQGTTAWNTLPMHIRQCHAKSLHTLL